MHISLERIKRLEIKRGLYDPRHLTFIFLAISTNREMESQDLTISDFFINTLIEVLDGSQDKKISNLSVRFLEGNKVAISPRDKPSLSYEMNISELKEILMRFRS